MNYTDRLTETQQDNLDGRIFETAQKHGKRSLADYTWKFDNDQFFLMARELLNSEAERIVKVNEPEQRDPTSGQTLMPHVLYAKSAMTQRGIPYAMFKEMFPKFLAEYDLVPAQRAIEISEKDAADPKGEYEGPNLTFDRLEIMRDFVAKQSDQCAPMVRINPETLLCLIDTIQHHEYVPQAKMAAHIIGVILPVVGSGTLHLEGEPGVTMMMDDYLQSLWQTGTPPTTEGDYDFYNVAVRRCHDPEKVYVFTAAYANGYDSELRDRDGNEFIANGWYDVNDDASGEFSTFFSPTLDRGDIVEGWQPLPKWNGA
jgi:hypothetical protein